MKARDAKIGEKYLSKTGATVTMTGEKDGKIVMKLASGIVFRCGPDYELKPIKSSAGAVHKPEPTEPKSKIEKSTPRQKPAVSGACMSLASIIDPFLLSGGHTVRDIAIELSNKAGDAAQGKNLEANVRARMVTYARKGWRVVKDESKRVKIVQSKG
ncbi:MAG: hypothetical protein WC421_06665 [Elusimicrobiales bacterium]